MKDAIERIEYNNAVRASALVEEGFRPSNMYRPRLSIDGDQWSALHGDNLQDGVCGFGDSPDAAYKDFDRAWYTKLDRT